MKLLALDTSSVACSVALQVDAAITERHEVKAREHTRLLVPMIRDLCADARCALAELDAIVLGNGPGSFIGMRIAASVAQGMAFAGGLKIVPVSSLAAVAAEVLATSDATEVAVAQDAHMHEVYFGLYRRDTDDLPEAVVAERICDQGPVAELRQRASGLRAAAGFGWQQYPQLLHANRGCIDAFPDVLYPRARYLLELGAAGIVKAVAIDPRDLAPAYLRDKVAAAPGPPS